nr:PREDICTED: uncharacterized protein LOC106701959 [Latimeria chalumnae]|eukprot:XP_014339490.1 PREDICTED: uncharacterized protein LOC106701959 [Latimeria chalumnae]
MDTMRLTTEEGVLLFLSSVLLSLAVFIVFKHLHGPLHLSLHHYISNVRTFHRNHPIISESSMALNHSVIRWHKNFRRLLDDIQRQFDTHLHCTHISYTLYVLLYITAVGTLLYYLVDNMIRKSRLTPKRIKNWVLLLVATATWTFLMLSLLVSAQSLEHTIEGAVYMLVEELGELAAMNLDLGVYNNIVNYWRFRCLPPTSQGVLSIFGIIRVRDISFYLQYYSLPVITALCTPVLKLLLAVKEIYT